MAAASFPTFLQCQLDELGTRVLREYERLHGDCKLREEGKARFPEPSWTPESCSLPSEGEAIQLPTAPTLFLQGSGEEPAVHVAQPLWEGGPPQKQRRNSRYSGCSSASQEEIRKFGVRHSGGSSATQEELRKFGVQQERKFGEEKAEGSGGLRSLARAEARITMTRGKSSFSLGAEAAQGRCLSANYVFLPGAFWYRAWANFVSVAVLASLFLTPMRFSFDETWDLVWLVRIFDAIFAMDIIATFNVGVMGKQGLQLRRVQICASYLRSFHFWLDLMALVPLDDIYGGFSEAPLTLVGEKVQRLLGMVRMLRVNRLLMVFRNMQKSTYFNLLGVVVAKYVIFILLCTHTSGCVFYALSSYSNHSGGTWVANVDPELPSADLLTRYVRVLFWAVATFKAGPMSGALGPYSNSEMLLACLTMMVNICLQNYLVSNMAALLTTADTRIYAMRNQLRQLEDFSSRYGLPQELRAQLRKCIRFKFASEQELDQSVLAGVPELHRQHISHVLFEEILLGVELFRGCGNLFLRQLHGCLKSMLYMPEQQLLNIDEPSSQLQILGEGEAEMRDRAGNQVAVALRCEVISGISFLCKVGQPFAVRTRTTCRILSVDHSDWDAVCQAFPENLKLVTQNLLGHCEERASEYEQGRSGHGIYTEMAQLVRDHMVHARETSLALFIAAAAHGDVAEIRRVLSSTAPDVADYDDRTPLHLAACNGQVEVITLLLAAGAEVDPMDNFGRTPLLEACRCNKPKAAQALFSAGARLDRGERQRASSAGATEPLDTAAEMCSAASDLEQLWYLKMLLKYGADPNIGDYDQRTALHVACATGNKAAVECLVCFKGIDLSPRDNFGRTPLMESVRHSHEQVAHILKERGAFHGFVTELKSMIPNAIPAGQELCQAAFANQRQYLHNLMSYCGLDVDATDYDLRTALMLACAEGNMAIAIHLVQHGADINRKDRWGHTALTEARDHGHTELAVVLQQLVRSEKGALIP